MIGARSAMGYLLCLLCAWMLGCGRGCQSGPRRGIFPLHIVALTHSKRAIPHASVFLNGFRMGQTDNLGVFVGTYRGTVGEAVKVRVVSPGGLVFKLKTRLRMVKRRGEWRAQALKVEAYMQRPLPTRRKDLSDLIRPEPMAPGARPRPRSSRRSHRPVVSSAPGPGKKIEGLPRCFQGAASGSLQGAVLYAPPGTRIELVGDCIESLGKVGLSGSLRLSVPLKIGTLQLKAYYPGGKTALRKLRVYRRNGLLSLRFSMQQKLCNLDRIRRKLDNGIRLEGQEIGCLRKERRGSPQFYVARLYLARAFCLKGKRAAGIAALSALSPQARTNPYRCFQLGMAFARCGDGGRSIASLRKAERHLHKMSVADRFPRQRSLYKTLSRLYEARYARTRKLPALRSALKTMKKLAEITMTRDLATCRSALKQVKRLEAKVNRAELRSVRKSP